MRGGIVHRLFSSGDRFDPERFRVPRIAVDQNPGVKHIKAVCVFAEKSFLMFREPKSSCESAGRSIRGYLGYH